MRVRDLMTSDVPAVSPGDQLREAARRMTERNCRALPVCDGEALVGIVTDWDITRAVAERGEDCTVHDFMSGEPATVDPAATLAEAASVMGARGIHHLLIAERGTYRGLVHLDVEWNDLGESFSPSATFAAPV